MRPKKRCSNLLQKSKCRRCYLAVAPISSFSSSPRLIGHPVMCGGYTATIPPGSRLSMYRLLAGVYYAEGRCQRGERRGGGGGVIEGGERQRGDRVEEIY